MSDNRDHGDETGADAYDESEPLGVSGSAAGCDIYGYPVHDWRDDKIAQQAEVIRDLDIHCQVYRETISELRSDNEALKRQIGAAVAQAVPLTEDERKQRDYAAIRRQRMPERY